MNYIGSKHSLLPAIRTLLHDRGILPPGVFFDAFAGTTMVGQLAKTLGFVTISNDLQTYSHLLAQTFLVNNEPPRFAGLDLGRVHVAAFESVAVPFGLQRDRVRLDSPDLAPLIRVLAHLDALTGHEGRFTDAYCEGGAAGRLYFERSNGMRCQAIRDRVQEWRSACAITELEAAILLASLLESLDQVANTASVYGAYLKRLKAPARARMTLRVPALIFGVPGHQAYCDDTNALARRLGQRDIAVLYLDPPYNQRQYNANYHILETVARWDIERFEPRGKTGLRPARLQDSQYCRRSSAARALAEVVDLTGARDVILSYNDEGLISCEQLQELLGSRSSGDADFRELPYKRFRADLDRPGRSYAGDAVAECLYSIRTRPAGALSSV